MGIGEDQVMRLARRMGGEPRHVGGGGGGDMGLDPSGITYPIGDKSLGKLPAQIAHGALIALIARTQTKVSA